jgi:hypothetical protein
VPIFSPPERRTGVPSTRSLAIKLWDWRVDVSVCMVASIIIPRPLALWEKSLALNGKRFAVSTVPSSEQGRHRAHLKRPDEDGAVDEANRKRHRRFAFERGALAERRD